MELFKFYKVDEDAKTLFYTFSKFMNSGGMMYNIIIFGVSSPPSFSSIYDAGFDEATKKEISNVLRFRYSAIIQFVFGAL